MQNTYTQHSGYDLHCLSLALTVEVFRLTTFSQLGRMKVIQCHRFNGRTFLDMCDSGQLTPHLLLRL